MTLKCIYSVYIPTQKDRDQTVLDIIREAILGNKHKIKLFACIFFCHQEQT